LTSEHKELKININFGTEYSEISPLSNISTLATNKINNFVCDFSSDGIETITCRFIRKTMDMWEGITIQDCSFYFSKSAEIVQIGDYFVVHDISGIKGTLVNAEYVVDSQVQDYIDTNEQINQYLIIHKHMVKNVICRNFEFLTKIIELKPKNISLEINLNLWSAIEYLSECDRILNLPRDSYISAKIFKNFKEYSEGINIETLSVDSKTMISQEMREGLQILTKFFIDVNIDELVYFDLMDEEDAKKILALLMEESSLQSLCIVMPNYQISLITAENMLKHDKLSELQIYAKGKDYLSECIRDRMKKSITKNFQKDINVKFQLPMSVAEL
jgi:hypothetical protein